MLGHVCLTAPSGISTHSYTEQEKSSGKSRDSWMFGLVNRSEPVEVILSSLMILPLDLCVVDSGILMSAVQTNGKLRSE